MIPITKAMLVLVAVGLGVIITTNFHKGKKSGIQTCVDSNPLREAAQKALDAIGSDRKLIASSKKAKRGQHVFNNGLLKFHRSVLKDLLTEVGGDEQLENLEQDLTIPLNETVRSAISTMVAHFSSDESYTDYNADLFGEYVKNLRKELVAYLKANTSVNEHEIYENQEFHQQVQSIATQMVNHEVYVDPMARDLWLRENRRIVQQYNQVRGALNIMFQNILQDFHKVSDKVREFRKGQKGNGNSELK